MSSDPRDVSFTIRCSNVEEKALLYVMTDIEAWLQATLNGRASSAIDEVVRKETARMMVDPNITSIPANRFQIVQECTQPLLRDAPPAVPIQSSNGAPTSNVPGA
jgi:hypothetical protein